MAWPALPVDEWQATRDTLHLWSQVLGKIRMANSPLVNHWWNVTLYVNARGLTTSLIPYGPGRGFEMVLDLVDHELHILTTGGEREVLALESQSPGAFERHVAERLDRLQLTTQIWPVPVEIPGALPFAQDTENGHYDPEHAHRFWQVLLHIDQVFNEFRAGFIGKASPVHLFWGALDLATTRFSGRTAPPHPGGAPNCGPHVMHEAYSHEASSCGYWPGGSTEGTFYSYAYPEPDGYRDRPVRPAQARYDTDLAEFVLPYEAVRQAAEPRAVLLDFLQTTYDAAAEQANWDRPSLERAP